MNSHPQRKQACGLCAGPCVILSLLFALPLPARGQCLYEVEVIEGPTGGGSARGINSAGHVVGYDVSGAFLWTPATGAVALDLPPHELTSRAYDINDAGQITGTYTIQDDDLGQLGFLFQSPYFADLGILPGGNWTEGLALNNLLQITGYSGNNITGPWQGFVWHQTVMTDLGPDVAADSSRAYDISNNGQVAGSSWTSGDPLSYEAFIWHEGNVTMLGPLPGGLNSQARGINDIGQVVGFGDVADERRGMVTRAFLWTAGDMIDLGTLPGRPDCTAFGINNAGKIVGQCSDSGQNQAAFIWQNGTISELNQLVAEDVCMDMAVAFAINDAGQIVGNGGVLGVASGGVLLTPAESLAGDLDDNNIVNVVDLLMLLAAWGATPRAADLDLDGVVGVTDLLILLSTWGPCRQAAQGACCIASSPRECAIKREACCVSAYGAMWLGGGTVCEECPPAPEVCGVPGGGDCCVGGVAPGCQDEDCCNTVCAQDPFCCDVLWDNLCAAQAGQLCSELCGP